MAGSIDSFKGLVSQRAGIARGNVYRVLFPSLPGASSTEVDLLCSAVNLPGRQIMTQSRRIGLINQKVAYDQAYDDVSLTFYLLNDYGIKNYFEVWQNRAINQDTLEVGYLQDYSEDITIQQLEKGFSLPIYQTSLGLPNIPAPIAQHLPKIGPFDFAQGELDLDFLTSDKVVYECKLFDAFPTTMNAVELSNDNEGIMQLTVQLSYKNWKGTATGNSAFSSSFLGSVVGVVGQKLLSKFL
jgi:hypothetical protein